MCTHCFETQSSPGCTCTRRSKFLTHSLIWVRWVCQIHIKTRPFSSIVSWAEQITKNIPIKGKSHDLLKLNMIHFFWPCLLDSFFELKEKINVCVCFRCIKHFFLLSKSHIHPKYYKHLKKGAHQSHLSDKKWAGFWQISLCIK